MTKNFNINLHCMLFLIDECYLEHTGATLYSDIQILNIFQDLKSNLYGNPHAFNISSKFTTDIVDQIRYKYILSMVLIKIYY